METTKGKVIVGFLAVLAGLFIAVQIRMAQGGDQGALVPVSKLRAYEAELKITEEQRDTAMSTLAEAEASLRQLEQSQAETDYYIKGLVTDLAKYKSLAGVSDMEGPGVIITIEDPPDTKAASGASSVIMYNYDLLLALINKLKEAGAEAISVNQQRMISNTEISLAGSNVNINGVPTAPPYEIRAIGDRNLLESALNIRFGIVEQMRSKYNLKVSILKENNLTVPRYSGVVVYNYAESVDNEDVSLGFDSVGRENSSTILGNSQSSVE